MIGSAGFGGEAVNGVGETGHGVVGGGDLEGELVNLVLVVAPELAVFFAVFPSFFGQPGGNVFGRSDGCP
ncbi:MAG TPA: hypothetical protein VGH38_25825 [Bryobacteraceae bacterium]